MNNQQSYNNDREIDGTDRLDQSGDGVEIDGTERMGLSGRLTEILVGEGDGDLVIGGSDEEETIMQWLQALDMQVMGACRADERLKPFLKHNLSTGVAEDRLVNQLSQHFEPSEVGLLARCLCIPLVSIRVGKINKEGTLLSPKSTRGNLTLVLLPTSDLRISFIGDDGQVERLSTLSNISDCSTGIEEIPADQSGRSFVIKNSDGELFYFWCSEKSRLFGNELLEKMKNLLKRKTSLTELTGISESRLENFATHLRAYLVDTTPQASSVVSRKPISKTSLNLPEVSPSSQSGPSLSKPSRSRPFTPQGEKSSSFNSSSLSPRPSSFKEGLPKNLATLRILAKEKFRRRGESSINIDQLSVSSLSNQSEMGELEESTAPCLLTRSSGLESLDTPFLSPSSHVPPACPSLMSPYCCWAPPVASALQYTMGLPPMPASSTESFTLPPLSSLLSSSPLPSSFLTPKPTLNLADMPSMDFPPFLPEPLIRLPLSMPMSQQFPTFTPLMCDPIVHIPVMDLCSAGQAYLVSAGPGMSTSIPPLLPTIMNHSLIQEKSESMVEKSARETLRLLLSGSSQGNKQLIGVLPSSGFYSGTRDVGFIANSIAAISMVSLTERCISQDDLVELQEEAGSYGENCPNNNDTSTYFSDTGEQMG